MTRSRSGASSDPQRMKPSSLGSENAIELPSGSLIMIVSTSSCRTGSALAKSPEDRQAFGDLVDVAHDERARALTGPFRTGVDLESPALRHVPLEHLVHRPGARPEQPLVPAGRRIEVADGQARERVRDRHADVVPAAAADEPCHAPRSDQSGGRSSTANAPRSWRMRVVINSEIAGLPGDAM